MTCFGLRHPVWVVSAASSPFRYFLAMCTCFWFRLAKRAWTNLRKIGANVQEGRNAVLAQQLHPLLRPAPCDLYKPNELNKNLRKVLGGSNTVLA